MDHLNSRGDVSFQPKSGAIIVFDSSRRKQSGSERQGGFQHFAGSNALIAYLGIDSREDPVALGIVSVVNIETATSNSDRFFAEQFFVPGLTGFGRLHPHFTVVV
ncbi:MAG: hypothetical protein ACKVZH_25150 [Blastocatellia bacterium]